MHIAVITSYMLHDQFVVCLIPNARIIYLHALYEISYTEHSPRCKQYIIGLLILLFVFLLLII